MSYEQKVQQISGSRKLRYDSHKIHSPIVNINDNTTNSNNEESVYIPLDNQDNMMNMNHIRCNDDNDNDNNDNVNGDDTQVIDEFEGNRDESDSFFSYMRKQGSI
jgi:hypothetical protein